jgi:hypothetical protein
VRAVTHLVASLAALAVAWMAATEPPVPSVSFQFSMPVLVELVRMQEGDYAYEERRLDAWSTYCPWVGYDSAGRMVAGACIARDPSGFVQITAPGWESAWLPAALVAPAEIAALRALQQKARVVQRSCADSAVYWSGLRARSPHCWSST